MASGKQVVATDKAPNPAPLISQALVVNGMVYTAGQIPVDPATGKLVEGTIKERTAQVFKNLQHVLEAAGSSLEKAVKVNIFVTNLKDVPALNEVYATIFPDPKPVRTCVGVRELPLGTDIEVECSGYI
ncbi:endoribonuclease L-PSP [Xylona heveae TC161]|uniref:Endoribonuclease L-PSP n=1 Tax=Xylona heveae (strain CBS 132557 / TC161) TaxID=1328760 RepID=A0A165JKC8_XYLHT|nr:endoribonuclease L-PSP [Xylona heveae TC161]KZF26344.1 endoribonuclease L-PSP [Xylona heveae TC161]